MSAITWHKSACNLCYINCGIEVAVADGRISKIRGDKANPRSAGYLCNKAQGIVNYVHHRDRLTTPLKRTASGGYEPITWDHAISEIAAKLASIVGTYGGSTLALYGGGGQGNHAGGAYATSLMRALKSRNVFNALAQEKTGDFWVNGHLFGAQTCHTAEDIEHCDLLFVLGANPWLAHGFTNARHQLNAIRKDPERHLVVVDPRRSETAELADLHLQVRPGADAFLLGALLATLQRRGAFDEDFLAQRTTGEVDVVDVLRALPVAQFAAAADIPLAQIEQAADLIMAAKRMVVRAELGIQQSRHSTLNSYLEKLLFLLTGHFARTGTNTLHSWLAPLWGNGRGQRYAPTDTEIIAGLLPPNVFADAILSPHPEHLRAVIVDSSNPLNTTADTARVIEAVAALELLVVVDVAFTETAQHAHYVLPASSQYEKCEYTLFNFEYPTNFFHVRSPVLPPLPGTLPEPEIYTRLARELGLLPVEAELTELAAAATLGAERFSAAYRAFMATHTECAPLTPLLLYNTLGRVLPDGTAAAAPLWLACERVATTQTAAVRAALAAADTASLGELVQTLFNRVVGSRSGMAFTTHDDAWSLLEHADRRVHLAIPLLLDALRTLDAEVETPDNAYPFVLSAGQRRLQNANQILREPSFRSADPDGALLIHPADLIACGVAEQDWLAIESSRARLIVRARADKGLRRGHVVLPHGYGQSYPLTDGERLVSGPRINFLTDSHYRDPIAGTPYHKSVPVRVTAARREEAAQAESNALRIAGSRQPASAAALSGTQ